MHSFGVWSFTSAVIIQSPPVSGPFFAQLHHNASARAPKLLYTIRRAPHVKAYYPESGDRSGIVGRVTAKLQRQHLAPRMSHNVGSKYGH
jgi:hypothetical protein